jgi:hypothetical protein
MTMTVRGWYGKSPHGKRGDSESVKRNFHFMDLEQVTSWDFEYAAASRSTQEHALNTRSKVGFNCVKRH